MPTETGLAPGELTNAAFIRRLESLFLLVRRVLGGSLQADRKSPLKGSGIMFADYAQYHPGDDYRAIDWRVFARTDELVVKLFEIEEDTTLYILLDLSASMLEKLGAAKKLAAALAYIALNCQDRVAIFGLADDLRPLLDPARGRTNVFAMLKALEAAPTFGSDTDFSTCTRQFQARHRKKGLVVVLSDFLFPGGFSEGLKRLTGLGHEVHAIQILSDGDLRCDWKGDVELECVETHQRRKITITAREADAYAQAVATWNTALQSECAQRAIGFNTVSNTVPFEDVIRNILRKGGLAS
jgi:uncharacterized protein (DUF58 family)